MVTIFAILWQSSNKIYLDSPNGSLLFEYAKAEFVCIYQDCVEHT